MLIWMPLEPLDQRYTAQWYSWFPKEFNRLDIGFRQINGRNITEKIEVGSVLDAYGTSVWKCTQLANLIELMRNGEITSKDTLLFADLWHPGIELLQYIGCLGGQRPHITGVLHAGVYDSTDFTYRYNMRPWAWDLESVFFQMWDLMFVGSQYHKNLILQNRNINPNKIIVTGLPFYPEDFAIPNPTKDNNLIVFPHRLDPEKRPWEFDALKEIFPQATFIKTKEHDFTKKEYFNTLSKALIAISFAQHENFGYGMLETTALGCIPLMPDGLSYAEYYPRELLYSTMNELYHKISLILSDDKYREIMQELVKKVAYNHKLLFSKSIENMIILRDLQE